RWSRASVTQRRLVAPVLGSCLVVTGLFVLDKPTQHSELALKLALPLIPICYLIGLVYRRLDRAGVAGLVVRLGDVPRITRLRELVASRARLVHAAESGRRQLERDLHDGVQQRLLAAAMMLGRAEHGTDQALVTEAKGTVLATLDELRALCQGIHPPVLTER